METRTDESLTYTFSFTELPKIMKITGPLGTQPITVSNANELLSDDPLLALSRALSCSASFPTTFFDKNSETYARNVKGFVGLLEQCLLMLNNYEFRGIKVCEKTVNNSYNTHVAKSRDSGMISQDR